MHDAERVEGLYIRTNEQSIKHTQRGGEVMVSHRVMRDIMGTTHRNQYPMAWNRARAIHGSGSVHACHTLVVVPRYPLNSLIFIARMQTCPHRR